MEITLTDDQALLRDTARRFIQDVCPLLTVRQGAERDDNVPDGYVAQAAELGWFAMLVPEDLGGGSVSGEGLRDLAIVAEERGAALQPGPFVSHNVVAEALATAATRTDVLDALVAGEQVASWAWSGATIAESAGGFRVDGVCGAVHEGARADWFLVSDGSRHGLVAANAPGVTVKPLASHDLTQRFAEVRFDGVDLDADAMVSVDGDHLLDVALVLHVAESIGAATALFEMTRQYAAERTAFGRPIGSFQAVKHQLADLALVLEAGKALSVAATRAVQSQAPYASEAASMAKAWIGDYGVDIGQGCFQVFAGIGYTWEHDLHFFLRRLTMNSLLYGNADWHRERICTIHGL
ncbi:MAG: acyl-CoA dehydrogenase family protein [Acidimicrobiia bacterium]